MGDFFQTDIAVKAITPNGTQLNLSNNQEITATIKNNGRNPVSGFTLSLYVNENFIATEDFPGVIQGLGALVYQGVARNETVSIKPKSHGFYIIQSGKRVKAVY